MFNRRHEQELAEIKALIHEIGQRYQDVLEQLDRIGKNQDELADEARKTAKAEASGGHSRYG